MVAFLSNKPVNEGHTLVVPRIHYENIFEISEEEAAYLFKIAKRITEAVRNATGIEGVRIVQNNGKDAGQIIFHLHVHIIPMKPHEYLHHELVLRAPELLDEDAQKIKYALKKF